MGLADQRSRRTQQTSDEPGDCRIVVGDDHPTPLEPGLGLAHPFAATWRGHVAYVEARLAAGEKADEERAYEAIWQRFWADTRERHRFLQHDPERPILPPS